MASAVTFGFHALRGSLWFGLLCSLNRECAFAEHGSPARLQLLVRPAKGQRIGRNIRSDDTASGYVGTVANADGRHKRGV
jgi:hypothetical protein